MESLLTTSIQVGVAQYSRAKALGAINPLSDCEIQSYIDEAEDC